MRGEPSDGQTSDGPFGPVVGGLYNHIWPPLLIKPYNRAFGIGRAIHRKVLLCAG